MRNWRAIVVIAGLGILGMPAFGADLPNSADPARPGTVNYIEGAAFINGRSLNNRNVGNVELDAGQVLTTGSGKAEILLTPGIFLRVDSNSAVKMISPDLAKTQVDIEHGRAGVEVDQIFPQNMVQIVSGCKVARRPARRDACRVAQGIFTNQRFSPMPTTGTPRSLAALS
jgi:hypothetical protein